MSRVRSRRWAVEVSMEGERREFGRGLVECAWISYWQRAGLSTIEVESVELWGEPWGNPIAALMPLDIRDKAPDWVRELVAEYQPS